MAEKYSKILPSIDVLLARFEGSVKQRQVEEIKEWAREFAHKGVPKGNLGRANARTELPIASVPKVDLHQIRSEYADGKKYDRLVARISDTRRFGFIRTPEGDDLFFHQSAVVSRNQCLFMAVGVAVVFKLGSNAKGYCATEVRLMLSKNLHEISSVEERVTACVVSRQNESDVAFAIVPEYGEIIVRKTDFTNSGDWNSLKEGDRIELIVTRDGEVFIGKDVSISTTLEGG